MIKNLCSSKIINGFNIVSPREADLHDLESKIKLPGTVKSAQDKGLIGWLFSLTECPSLKDSTNRAYDHIYSQAMERSASIAVITTATETNDVFYLEAELYQ